MQERYLFKAKRIDNGEWVEGYYTYYPDGMDNAEDKKYAIRDTSVNPNKLYFVDPSTICQCTGFVDKNGKFIWENDIMEAHLDDNFPEDVTRTRVVWDKNGWVTSEPASVDRKPLDDFDAENFEVIGNTFDNPELLEV